MTQRWTFLRGAWMHISFRLIMIVVLALSAIGLVWLGQATDLDLDIAKLSYDVARKQFPIRDSWLASQFFHVYIKAFVVMIAVGFFACALLDLWRPETYWTREVGWRLRTVAVCAVLIPLTVNLLKQNSRLHCPWDLAMFGGVERYFRLVDRIPAGTTHIHCFPAGHASGGLWLASIMVIWFPGRPRTAWMIGFGLFGVGLMMGIVQQMRGAHFTTHTLWSAWIAIVIIYAAYSILTEAEMRLSNMCRSDELAHGIEFKSEHFESESVSGSGLTGDCTDKEDEQFSPSNRFHCPKSPLAKQSHDKGTSV